MSCFLTENVTLFDLLWLCSRAREDEIVQYEALVGPWNPDVAANEFWMNRGPKFAVIDEEGPVVAGGWSPIIDGVYQSWMVGREGGWDKRWRSITKYSRRVMDAMLDKDGGIARRLQTSASESRSLACKWYEKGLRMKYEGRFENFGLNGEAMVNYALTKEQNNG